MAEVAREHGWHPPKSLDFALPSSSTRYNQKKGGYRGIFREAGEDTGTYFREITDLEFQNHKNVKKMYFPHTRTSWDKFMFNGMPNSNFKIGLSLFGCAEKYTEQSTHYAV